MRLRKAPPGKKEKDPEWIIDNIAEASKNARRIYLLFIGFLAYCTLTIVSTTDREIILNETARLPIINIDVSIFVFFISAPLLAIFIFVYLLLYILRLNNLHAKLLKDFPSTEKERLYPWMINIAKAPDPGAIGKLQKAIVNFSLWWLLPIVLILFPLGFLRKHDPILSYVVGFIPVIGTAVVIWFWCQYEQVELDEFIHRNLGKTSLSIIVLLFGMFFIFFMIPWSRAGDNTGILRPLLYVDLSFQKLVNEPNKDYKTLYWANFVGANLQGANFTGSILKKANLKKANLNKANFYNANLEGALLEDAKLQSANLRKAKLDSADLSGAHLQGAHLDSAQLQGAKLIGAHLQGAHLDSAQLQGAKLRGAHLQGAFLRKAQLQGAELREAQLQGAILNSAELQGAILWKAELDSAKLVNAQLQGAFLKLAKLDNADFRNAKLQDSDLEGAKLRYAKLDNTNLMDAKLKGTDFSYAKLKGARNLTIEQLSKVKTLYKAELDSILLKGIETDYPHLLVYNAELHGIDLSFAELQDTNLVEAQLQGANLRGAQLQGANLRGAQLQGASLRGAQLDSADLLKAKLQGADFSNAQLLGAENLTIEQLSKVKTLYKAELDSILLKGIETNYPHLLLSPKEKILPKPKRP